MFGLVLSLGWFVLVLVLFGFLRVWFEFVFNFVLDFGLEFSFGFGLDLVMGFEVVFEV